jgi:hypothetical protein
MEKWEYILVTFIEDLRRPTQILVSPPGIVDLKWLTQCFGVRVWTPGSDRNMDVIDKLFNKAAPVSTALLQYLGLNGWEMIGFSATVYSESTRNPDYDVFFKRPVVNS